MKKVITIQHPQSEQHMNGMIGSWGDWDLTELGVEQARHIGENLLSERKDEKFVLYASDLRRAKHTAEIISAYLQLEPKYSPLLREFDLGEANGKSKNWAKENKMCPVWPGTIDWAKNIDDRVFRHAESKRDVWHRVQAFFDQMISPSNENFIIVSHDGTLSMLFAIWLGMDIKMLNSCNLSGKSGGVSLMYEDSSGNRTIKRLNDMSYVYDRKIVKSYLER